MQSERLESELKEARTQLPNLQPALVSALAREAANREQLQVKLVRACLPDSTDEQRQLCRPDNKERS